MRGYTLIEVLVTMSFFVTLLGIAIPKMNSSRLQINTTQRFVMANLRLARTNAITKSVHYKVEFPSITQLKVEKMMLVSGAWQVDTGNVQTLTLPSGTNFATGVVNTSVEYNSRGIAVNLTQSMQVDMLDNYGVTKSLQAWPSGQVNEL